MRPQNEVVIRVEELPEVRSQSIVATRRRRSKTSSPSTPAFKFAAGPNEELLFVAQKYWLVTLSALLNVFSLATWIESASGRDAFLCVLLTLFGTSLFFRNDLVYTRKCVYWSQTVAMSCFLVYFVTIFIVHRIFHDPESAEDSEDVLLLTFPVMSWFAAAILFVLARLLCHAYS